MKKNYLFIYLFIYLFGCSPNKTKPYNISINIVGKFEYFDIYKKALDSIANWSLNNLGYYQYLGKSKIYNLDSLICFNKDKDRFISCILMENLLIEANSEGIDFFYGEKINDKWYFFSGPHIVCPRTIFKDNPLNKPLSYSQLHQIALKEVYSGYLNSHGEINEDWFTSHFEGSGYGDFNNQSSSLRFLHTDQKFTDKRKFFEAIHLQSIKNNWYGVNKDSIKQLPTKTTNLP